MPEDIHDWIWILVCKLIDAGEIAVTKEFYDEMVLIGGSVGECIKRNRDSMVLEIGDDSWAWRRYVSVVKAMQSSHRQFISEYTSGSPKTVGVNDISIIALAKSINLPLVSMERLVLDPNSTKMKIPNVCQIEGVVHLDFSDFLRAEKGRP